MKADLVNRLRDYAADRKGEIADLTKEATDAIEELQAGKWISVEDRLPENASHPGALCPRYLVCTPFGVTEGWYNPDKGYWYGLFWFKYGTYNKDDIAFKSGDIPKTVGNCKVTHWMPLPELPKGDLK